MKKVLILIFFACITALAQNGNELVKAKIVLNGENLSIGKNQIGVLFTIEKGWHIYWLNPGDSGLPTYIEWELPEGVEISEAKYPIPEKIPFSDMANFGYENEVLVLYNIIIPEGLSTDEISLKANVSWLVCKEKCLPGSTELHNSFAIKEKNEKQLKDELFAKFQSKLAIKKNFEIFAVQLENSIRLIIKDIDKYDNITYFPYESGVFSASADQNYMDLNGSAELQLTLDEYRIEDPTESRGILKVKNENNIKAFEINFTINK